MTDTFKYRWSSDRADDQFAVENPATDKTIAIIQGAGQWEVDDAVCAAETAFQKWRWSNPGERAAMIRRIARKVGEHLDDVAQLEMEENGKPLLQAKTDVHGAVALFEYYANLIGMQPTQLFDGGLVYGATLLEPHGVVAAIIPFNWPPVHTASKIAAALAVGNTVVVKPPALRAADDRAHSGDPARRRRPRRSRTGPTGAAIASHPMVRMITFTGSPSTGRPSCGQRQRTTRRRSWNSAARTP